MADIVARDELTPGSAARARNSARTAAERSSPGSQPPRSDVGTLLLHWVTAGAFLVSLFTGIRIAADAYHAPVSHWLSPILPQGQIWTWHFYAGLTLFFCAAAYFVYMRRAALFSRNALKKTRVMVMPVASKMRFGGLNVLLHWAAYVIVGVMTITGIFLYLGHGGWLISDSLLRGLHRPRLHLRPRARALSLRRLVAGVPHLPPGQARAHRGGEAEAAADRGRRRRARRSRASRPPTRFHATR
jgi:cytochrome b561